jgi:predicted acylesterase/phospholipase RssA
MFDAVAVAVAFAGGGNRCYWQGGFWEAAAPLFDLKPMVVAGVSAGAWSACSAWEERERNGRRRLQCRTASERKSVTLLIDH